MIYEVIDFEAEKEALPHYHIALFSSSPEPRCTWIPSVLKEVDIDRVIVLGFPNQQQDPVKQQSDAYFLKHWVKELQVVAYNDDAPLYKYLRETGGGKSSSVRILVDYSCMSRIWYAAALNWARHTPVPSNIVVDFLYAVGEHKNNISPVVIRDILSIPGCEGNPTPFSKSIGVFGLGFDNFATLCVLDRLEPDVVYTYLANPAAFDDYPERARKLNEVIREKYSRVNLELPLCSVERTYVSLTELISPHRSEADIVLVPMGPKPHVLAAILLSMRFPGITCLDVSGSRPTPERVGTTKRMVGTRVVFEKTTPEEAHAT
jgi:hypothetical protein